MTVLVGLQGAWNLKDVQFPAGSQIKSWAFTTLVDPNMLIPTGEMGTDTFLNVSCDFIMHAFLQDLTFTDLCSGFFNGSWIYFVFNRTWRPIQAAPRPALDTKVRSLHQALF